MKTAQEQLATYKSVHLNPRNLATHFIGVPLIIWSIAVLLSKAQWTLMLSQEAYSVNLAQILFSLALLYYFKLHWRMALGMLLFLVPLVISATWAAQFESYLLIALSVLVVGWVFQFIGHHFEKAKPAFIEDLNQLLIGPFFLISEIYFALGLGKPLNQEVTLAAIKRRKSLEAMKKSSKSL
ncbi:Mpo1 family 2-hydroxy fatty acid dioxygenase [Aliikangiella sp. IMCC44653]